MFNKWNHISQSRDLKKKDIRPKNENIPVFQEEKSISSKYDVCISINDFCISKTWSSQKRTFFLNLDIFLLYTKHLVWHKGYRLLVFLIY